MSTKVRVAICSQDSEYKQRFIRCFLHHFRSRYDLFTFERVEDIGKDRENTYHVLLIENALWEEAKKYEMPQMQIIVLYEPGDIPQKTESDRVCYEAKYQEVYKIQNAIQSVLRQDNVCINVEKKCQMIGVTSLGCENLQTAFCALLAAECSEKGKTLVLNLQPYSGLETQKMEDVFYLEDVILCAQTKDFARGRVEGAIGHEENWDFVYSVRNTECLAEATDEIYQSVVELLVQEMGYAYIIINFGATFLGVHRVMSACQPFYLLTNHSEERGAREERFFEELTQRGHEDFAETICRMDMPRSIQTGQNWRQNVQQWRWGVLGDRLRMHLWERK